MGCNTSQELKTKDGAAMDAVSNGEPEPSAPPLEGGESSKSSAGNHSNHAESNSITSNGDAKAANGGGGLGGGSGKSEATNGIDRPCDKAAITEFNDDDEDEGKARSISDSQYIHIKHLFDIRCVCVWVHSEKKDASLVHLSILKNLHIFELILPYAKRFFQELNK